MIDAEALKILCCPETHKPLRIAERALVTRLNEAIAARTLRNRAGLLVEESIDGGLVRADDALLFLVRQNIPVMLGEEAIPLPL